MATDPNPNKPVYSPIALDLGAMNTGVYLAHASENGGFDTRGAVVCLANDKLTFMQTGRTAKRHQRRGIARKRMVRRLLWQILEDHFGLDYDSLPKPVSEFVNGLLHRRGFTYLSLDEVPSPEEFADIEASPYLDLFPALRGNDDAFCSLVDLLKAVMEDVELARGIVKSRIGNKEAKDFFKKAAETDAILGAQEDYMEGFKALKQTAEATDNALSGGHKPRWDYLRDIEADILSSAGLLSPVVSKFAGGGRAFARLVGNLSNLQLRVLRRYFNDPGMKGGGSYDGARLRGCIHRWMLSWHVADKDKAAARKELCAALGDAPSALDWLLSTPPERTIPPFEDQDNRRHPTDRTLLLDDGRLTRLFPLWRELADALMEAERDDCSGMLLDSLDEICALPDRKADAAYLTALMRRDEAAKSVMRPFPDFADKRRLYFLARLFDRSKALDPYLCRELARFGLDAMERRESAFPAADDAFSRLRRALSPSDESMELMKTFFALAGKYYAEQGRAKDGLWFDSPDCVFRVSGLNTPRKGKIKCVLVGNILGQSLSADEWNSAETALDGVRLGRTGFWRALEFIEDTRKRIGNSFAEEYAAAKRRIDAERFRGNGGGRRKGKVKSDGVAPELRKVAFFVEEAAKAIADCLGHDETRCGRYGNPFSLAQLYVHAKGDVVGFSRTCEAVARENQWRSMAAGTSAEESPARCSRMVADTTRPFDGALARILERQARRIADLKLAQIGDAIPAALEIHLFLEENAFTFTEGLAKVKTGKGPQGKQKRRLARLSEVQERWADKDTRIREASKGLCPYTGASLGDKGEIDHIIPRSLTRKFSGTVFNHEANLIYCSKKGNADKGDRAYGIENLDPRYLASLFGTSDVAMVKSAIRETVSRLAHRRDIVFQSLSEEERRDIRHALFMRTEPEVFHAAMDIVRTQVKTRVNGTQAYLAKMTCEFLAADIRKLRPDAALVFQTRKVPAEAISDLRRRLAELSPEKWRKDSPQPVSSHVRDALLALVCGEDGSSESVSFWEGDAASGNAGYTEFLDGRFPCVVSVLQQSRRDGCDLPKASSRALFKDTLYQEHFIPVWSSGGTVCLGFRRGTLVKVKDRRAEAFYAAVRPFLRVGADGHAPAETLAEFVASPETCWPIDKAKAVAWLFEYERTRAEDDGKTYKALEALRYTTCKANVIATLFGKGKVDYGAIGKMKPVKIDFAEGDVALPIQDAWLRLEQAMRAAGVEDGCADAARVEGAVRRFFAPQGRAGLQHRRVRKVFSLPIPASPSGGVRIRRRDWRGGEVIQLAAGDFPSIGFRRGDDGVVDFNSNVRHPALAGGRNISFVGDAPTPEGAAFESFGAWREVPCGPQGPKATGRILRLALSPNSRDRMRVRCAVAWETVAKAVEAAGLSKPESAFSLMSELPPDVAAHCGLWKARSKLFVEEIRPDAVTFSYIVESTSADMKERYNASLPNQRQ